MVRNFLQLGKQRTGTMKQDSGISQNAWDVAEDNGWQQVPMNSSETAETVY